MLVPMLLLLLDVAVRVMSAEVSVQVVQYNELRKTQNGPVMCALDTANQTIVASSLQDCSRTCAWNAACIGFNIKNLLACDLYSYKVKFPERVSACINYQVA